jgi:hypothetical protein
MGWDINTLIFDYQIYVGRSANTSLYGTYPGNGAAVIPSGSAGAHLWFPANNECSGAVADTTCVGFRGMMSGAGFKLTSSDPLNDYALDSSSLYHAGNVRAAHDGTDMGADMNKIRQAITETTYSGCAPGECGPTGPQPD